MRNLQKTRVYYIGLHACYWLPHPAQPYRDFTTLRARHEEINFMDVVPHGPPIPTPPLILIYAPAPAPTTEEGLKLDEPVPVVQHEPLNGMEPQAPIFLVVNNL